MHRRSRHLNPKAAGALIALDARFLSLSGGASISSWTNRTGTNNLDQATAANQPTFQTAVQGGSPVVRFDASNDFFSIGGSLNFKDKLTFITTLKNNITGNITILAKESGDVDFVLWGSLGIGLSQSGVKWLINEGATSPTAWQIISATWNGSNTATIFRNASQVNTSAGRQPGSSSSAWRPAARPLCRLSDRWIWASRSLSEKAPERGWQTAKAPLP